MLSCCVPLSQVKEQGITISIFKCLAECNGAAVETFSQYPKMTLQSFRDDVVASTSQNACNQALVVSYSRIELGQTGDGHFSPIGAYSSDLDAVLILDVARFKYPAHWVPLEVVFKAMQRHDPVTNKPRGYFVFKPALVNAAVVFFLRIHLRSTCAFFRFKKLLSNPAIRFETQRVACTKSDDISHVVACFFSNIPDGILKSLVMDDYMAFNFDSCGYIPHDYKGKLESFQAEAEKLPLYQTVSETLLSHFPADSQPHHFLSFMFFMAFPIGSICDCSQHFKIQASNELLTEIELLGKQFELLVKYGHAEDSCCS